MADPQACGEEATDGLRATATATQRGSIEELKRDRGGLSFHRRDDVLPMPIDARAEATLELAGLDPRMAEREAELNAARLGGFSTS